MTILDRLSAAWSALRQGSAVPDVQAAGNVLSQPGMSTADAWASGLFGPVGDQWGPAVTDQTAMRVGTVYACLDRLSGAVGQLPLHEYTIDPGGDRVRAPVAGLWWLVNESPSNAWTASAWKAWIVRCVKLRGDQHTEIIRDRAGRPIELRPHHPDYVQTRTVDGRLRYDVCDRYTGQVHGVDQDDMLHFAGFGFDGERSLSAIRWAARDAVSTELGAAQYLGKSVTEGGMPRIALEQPGKVSEPQAQALRDAWLRIYGDGNGAKLPLVLGDGAKAHELSISPVDLQLLESRKMSKADICAVMGVPPILIGDSEKTSSWGTGVEQITLGWVRFSIQPLLCGWEEELNRKLFRRAGRFLEFNLAALLRGDSVAQANAFRVAIGGPGTGDGWLSVNEVRRLLNLPGLGPEYDTPYWADRPASQTPAQGS